MMFIGYEPNSKAYRFYDPENKKLVVSRDVIFEEDRCWDWGANPAAECSDASFTVHYPARQIDTITDAVPKAEPKTPVASTGRDPPSVTPAAPHLADKCRQANDGRAAPLAAELATPPSGTP